MEEKLFMDKTFNNLENLTPLQYRLIKILKEYGPSTRRELVKHLNIRIS